MGWDGMGGGGTLVALFLWLNNGREEMLTMADRENHVEVERASWSRSCTCEQTEHLEYAADCL